MRRAISRTRSYAYFVIIAAARVTGSAPGVHGLDADGQPMRRVGYHLFWLWPRPVSSNSGFFVPTDAAVGPDGAIHVADSGNHRVVMLSAEGEYLAEWRIPDVDPNIFSPEHIAASPDGLTFMPQTLPAVACSFSA